MADTANLTPIASKQWLITVEGVDGTWRVASAPTVTRESINYTDPTLGRTRQHLGFQSNDDVTLTRDYDAKKDSAVLKWCQERLTGAATVTPFTITISPVYADVQGTPYDGSAKYTLTGCYLKSYKWINPDRGGNNLTEIQIVVTWEDIASA